MPKVQRHQPLHRVIRRVLVVGLFVLVAVGFGASPARAHASLEGTDPPRGSIADTAPTVITMNFSERVVPVDGRIKVVAPDGKNVAQGEPTTVNNGTRLRIPVQKDLADGTYLVSYRVISADGHPISGGYTFSVRVPSALGANAADLSAGAESASVDGGVRAAQSVSRYAAYAGLSLLAGPLVILLGLWPRRLATLGPRRLAWAGWGLLVGGTLGTLILQQPYAGGGTLADVTLSGIGGTLDETVGRALLTRLGLLIAAIPVLIRVLRPAAPADGGDPRWAGPIDRALVAVLGVAVLITFPYAGHAAQSPAPLLSIPAITLHVGAMAVWLGGLAVLARYLLPRARYRELEVILPVWSRWAFWAVGALVFSGLIETFLEIGGFSGLDRLVNTTYGQLVLTKVIWLGAIMVVASNARAWIRRRFGVPVAYALAAEEPGKKPGSGKAAESGKKPGSGKAAESGKAAASKATAGKAEAGKASAGKRSPKKQQAKAAGDADDADAAETAGDEAPDGGPKGAKRAPAKKAPAKPAEDGGETAPKKRGGAATATASKAPRKGREPEPETADFSAAGRAADEVRRLRTRVGIEVLLGAVVLALATALVQVAPARSADDAAEAAANLPYTAQVNVGPNVLQIDLSPARIGTNELHLTAFDKNGLPVKVEEWGGSAELPSGNVSTDVVALPLTENHAVGQVDLPLVGDWKFTFTLRTSDIDQYSVTRTITIR
ncbi:copper resistance CopC/CopD family protein [Cryptosporangium minutisporangium]|uniref:Copper resistance protein CopC n=1 Tax=Cryptosporangium minutisporangium TaxID=113569 RepID=A0ABP6SVV8_9ACTN